MDRTSESQEYRDETRAEAVDSHQAALLIDFDNVTMGIRSNLGQELRNLLNSEVIRGKVAVQRAYADWRRYPQYIVPLSETSIDLIFAPAYGSSKKNATDIRLAIDALELVFVRPEILTYILMSGDSDFSSLVLKLKEYGKYVIGVGIQESSSDLLVQNCDEYYSYSALSGLSKTGDQPVESHDPWVLTRKAVEKMVERGDTMRSDRLKQVMLEIDPSFSEKEQGFNKFNRFVVDAASRNLLSIQKMENGQYAVAPAGGSGATRSEKKEAKAESRRELGRRGKEKPKEEVAERPAKDPGRTTQRARPKLTMESALALLDRALDVLLEGKDGTVRDSDVKRRLLEIDPDFDEGELGYSKFSKFLVAAEEAEAVKLTRGPNGNFHVSRTKPGKRKGAAKPRAPASEPEQRSDNTMQRLARFLFGSPKEPEKATPEPQGVRRERRPAGTGPRAQSPASRRRAGPGGAATESAEVSRGRKGPRGGRPEGEAARGGRSQRAEPRSGSGRRAEPRAGSGRRAEPRAGSGRRPESGTAGGASRGERREREEGRRPRETKREHRPREPREKPAKDVAAATPAAAPAPDQAETRPATSEVGEARAADQKDTAAKPAPLPGAPRGTIRGRWGSRGRYRPAQAPPPIFDGQAGAKDEASESTDETEKHRAEGKGAAVDRSAVARLTGYEGVGERTAVSLVEAFGSDLFRILDEEPDRVREVLSDRRAEKVLEARRQERESLGS
jgi:uncharacterized protein (TIGR00288 family)